MKGLVVVFSLAHRLACFIKDKLYAAGLFIPRKAPLPVVSVGNIAFGGSEKTPLAMEVLRFLSGKGMRPALITRGYKGSWERRGGVLSNGTNILGTWEEGGDEPFMVARDNPSAGVFVGRDRLRSACEAARLGFNVAVLDDGFQHRRLARDVDIALYNPDEKIALRESPSALSRAHIILVKKETEGERKEKLKARFPGKKIIEYAVVPRSFVRLPEERPVPISDLKDKSAVAFCGIANPNRFFGLLRRIGVNVVFSFVFPDHHPYPEISLKKIKAKCEGLGPDAAVTTEKDAVKLAEAGGTLAGLPLYYLKISLAPEEEFYEILSRGIQ